MDKLHYLFWASRPVSWINTAYPFGAGYLLTSHRFDATLLIGFFYFLIPYNLLLYGINDVFDYESDIKNPRKGGIEGTLLARSQHRTVLLAATILNLPFIILLLSWGDTVAKAVLVAVMFTVLAYSVPKLRFKERPFLDSVTSSAHFVGPLLYALVLTGWQAAYWPIAAAFFLWGMASHAFGAVQDIQADRAGGLSSIATYLGASTTVWLAISLHAGSFIILASRGLDGFVCGLINLLYVANIWPYRNITVEEAEQSNQAWRRFLWLNMVSGFIITLVLIKIYLK